MNINKYPSAWLPLLMSFAAVLLLVGFIVFVGFPAQPAEDEGTAAHMFQLLMGGQVPIIAYFAIRYLPKKPIWAYKVIAIQILVSLIPFALLYIFEH